MNNKKLIWLVIILLAALILVFWFTNVNRSADDLTNPSQNALEPADGLDVPNDVSEEVDVPDTEEELNAAADFEPPIEEVAELSPADFNDFETYLRANINELSPEPAVLGGTFYVTSITWQPDGAAMVEYEDGHIAFSADVVMARNANLPSNIEVVSFNIIQ